MSENLASEAGPLDGEKTLKRYERVPEKIPSILTILSPVATKFFKVSRTGKPAPTVDSWKPLGILHLDVGQRGIGFP